MIVEKDGVKYYVPESMPDEFRIDGGWYQFYDDDEDDDEGELYQEKELYRLRRVLGGLKNKQSKMLYVYRVNDNTLSEDARADAREKMERTKSWRGLQYDIKYVVDEIKALEEVLGVTVKRGDSMKK